MGRVSNLDIWPPSADLPRLHERVRVTERRLANTRETYERYSNDAALYQEFDDLGSTIADLGIDGLTRLHAFARRTHEFSDLSYARRYADDSRRDITLHEKQLARLNQDIRNAENEGAVRINRRELEQEFVQAIPFYDPGTLRLLAATQTKPDRVAYDLKAGIFCHPDGNDTSIILNTSDDWANVGIYLPAMTITLMPSNNTFTVAWKNSDDRRNYRFYEGGPHPHILSRGRPCLGSWSDILAQTCENVDVFAMALAVDNFLHQANHGDIAGRSWHWRLRLRQPNGEHHANRFLRCSSDEAILENSNDAALDTRYVFRIWFDENHELHLWPFINGGDFRPVSEAQLENLRAQFANVHQAPADINFYDARPYQLLETIGSTPTPSPEAAPEPEAEASEETPLVEEITEEFRAFSPTINEMLRAAAPRTPDEIMRAVNGPPGSRPATVIIDDPVADAADRILEEVEVAPAQAPQVQTIEEALRA